MNEIEIKYQDSQMLVSSVEVAKNFNKKHKNVLKTIHELMGVAQNSASLFYETSYIHEQNKQEFPMYYMNRDGFSLLVMGFTGKEALEWKMKYIKAFNEMEQKLNNPEFLVQRTMEYLKNRCDALLLENKIQSQQIAELQPKASYYDVVLNCAEKGFTSTKTSFTQDKNGVAHAHVHTYWTQKGRLFIYDLMKKDGILPLIERGEENGR